MGCSGTKAATPAPMLLGADAPKSSSPASAKSEGSLWTLQTFHGQYLCAEPTGDAKADRVEAKQWEQICFESRGEGQFALKGFHGKYLCAEPSGVITWDRDEARSWETFELCSRGDKWTLRSFHGKFLCAAKDATTLVADRVEAKDWELFTCVVVSSAGAPVKLQNGVEDITTEERNPLSLAELAAACSSATANDIAATLADMPESSLQKLMAALDTPEAVRNSEPEPIASVADADSVQIVDENAETQQEQSKYCGVFFCG